MTLFERIVAREIPADIVHETDDVLAFRDINPVAPTHILVIPKKPIVNVGQAAPEDEALLGKVMMGAADAARALGLEDYRLVVNNGAGAGQTVFHLHVHVLAGRPLSWPPG